MTPGRKPCRSAPLDAGCDATDPGRNIVFQRLKKQWMKKPHRLKGSIFVEYLLLLTIVGIGVIVGLASVRTALVNELVDLANAINAINT
jgi:pilus assembly protein Flp/PilA